ncbi:TetR-like C-terminal domain-containing protein [Microvirga roseola]|uniref:TetR-like C-terminal domain-containing protein n=1 Tax=Microvirga roseola TaxID=2883126 RepID=UPI001E2FD0E9|nr:TetR-like C-terminal domain-containing protein [Microvirga roseola]
MLAAVAADGFRRLRDAFEAAIVNTQGDCILAIGQGYLRFASDHPGTFRLMFGSGLDRQAYPELQQEAQQAFAVLLDVAAGSGAALPREAALGAWSLVHGLSHLVVDNQLSRDLQEDALSGRLLERISKVFGLLDVPGHPPR